MFRATGYVKVNGVWHRVYCVSGDWFDLLCWGLVIALAVTIGFCWAGGVL